MQGSTTALFALATASTGKYKSREFKIKRKDRQNKIKRSRDNKFVDTHVYDQTKTKYDKIQGKFAHTYQPTDDWQEYYYEFEEMPWWHRYEDWTDCWWMEDEMPYYDRKSLLVPRDKYGSDVRWSNYPSHRSNKKACEECGHWQLNYLGEKCACYSVEEGGIKDPFNTPVVSKKLGITSMGERQSFSSQHSYHRTKYIWRFKSDPRNIDRDVFMVPHMKMRLQSWVLSPKQLCEMLICRLNNRMDIKAYLCDWCPFGEKYAGPWQAMIEINYKLRLGSPAKSLYLVRYDHYYKETFFSPITIYRRIDYISLKATPSMMDIVTDCILEFYLCCHEFIDCFDYRRKVSFSE